MVVWSWGHQMFKLGKKYNQIRRLKDPKIIILPRKDMPFIHDYEP
ncbi:uncharacterized protein G2W53_038451 [Senna tora]|uniref:Uncharacterized protein n=1 Tax=Senna tora TaxID=362788 RepID=A0A834SKX3_9FABA|nr:uncharacterized protein G2W53_038451 [Senna tora]